MRVRLKFVGVARRQTQLQDVERDLAPGTTVGAAVAEFGFAHEAEVSVLVNGKAAEWGSPLADGDEVVVVPPLVGGAAHCPQPGTDQNIAATFGGVT